MPKIEILPKFLKPYLFHGVQIEIPTEGENQAQGNCPFCSSEGKFFISIKSGLWQCKVCGTGSGRGGGNVYTFLRELWKISNEKADGDINALAKDRKFLFPETLSQWGVCKSILTDEWLVPGYGPDRNLCQLYRYSRDYKSGKLILKATSGLGHQLHGMDLFDSKKKNVFICEGPWDGMALWEVMKIAKDDGDDLAFTANEKVSLLKDSNVIAVPGCSVFNEQWAKIFQDKRVVFLYDNDYPKGSSGPSGFMGMKRTAHLLMTSEFRPESINILVWEKDVSKGWTNELPDGHDVRDELSVGVTTLERVKILHRLMKNLKPIPDDWALGKSGTPGVMNLECKPCTDWKTLTNAWRKAMKWTEGLDRALSIMLACVTSTKMIGDQLWCKIIGPPSCGKSTLCEAISVSKKYIKAVSTLRGFHSGFKVGKKGPDEDNSLIVQINGKTLVIKDGDTLLQAPNLGQILSEGRDLYDSTSRSHYRNKMGKDYHGIRVTFLLCGTESLRKLDDSELGDRFFDCVIMDVIDEELEDDVNKMRIKRVISNKSVISDGRLDTHQEPAMTEAMQLTGGYVEHLRDNAQRLQEEMDEPDDRVQDRLNDMAKFVAHMRARPSLKQAESAGREMSTRLAIQFTRLALFLASALGRNKVDDEVLRRVKRTAMDTARGRTLEICSHLHRLGEAEFGTLLMLVNVPEDKLRILLRFMRHIGIIERVEHKVRKVRTTPRWRLVDKFERLYKEIAL